MPQLDNPRHERFCQLVAAGQTRQNEAYKAVYGPDITPDTAHNNASRLLADTDIKARVSEIQGQFLEKAAVLSLARKRQLLHDMALQERPTKRVVITGPDGETQRQEYDAHAAIKLDAELAGELSGNASGIQITLSIDQRRVLLDGSDTLGPVIEAQSNPVDAAKPLEIEPGAGTVEP